MAGQIVTTQGAPHSPLCALGVRVGSQIWVSGVRGIDAVSGHMAGPTIQQQTEQTFRN